MTDYEKALTALKESILKDTSEVENIYRRKIIKISGSDFRELIELTGSLNLKKKGIVDKSGEPVKYQIFSHLKLVINEFYYYMIGQKYNINSGIGLTGNKGTGKTLAILTFLNLMVKTGAITAYNHINARTFHQIEDQKKYEKGVLFIEEFGKNPSIVKNYGTEEQPIVNLLMKRYDTREITFVDSNLNSKSLSEIYGQLLDDRFKQMINFIEVKGESLRQLG